MESNEIKSLWEMENESLKNRIQLNEKVITNMNLKSAASTFKVFMNISLAGRNLALVYGVVSVTVGISFIDKLHYSLPIFVGALLMFWSFYHHLAIEKFRKNKEGSVVELQKSIEQFRLHSARAKYYDFLVVAVWSLSLAPVFIRYRYNLDIYANVENLFGAGLILAAVLLVLLAITRYGYNMYDRKLKSSHSKLSEIMQFEKE